MMANLKEYGRVPMEEKRLEISKDKILMERDGKNGKIKLILVYLKMDKSLQIILMIRVNLIVQNILKCMKNKLKLIS